MKIPATIVTTIWLRLAAIACAALTIATAAGESANLFEGKGTAEAIAKITAKIKTPVRVLVIEIEPTTLSLQVQDPATPTHIDGYKYAQRPGVLALLGDAAVSGPHPVQLSLINPRLEENLFTLTDVNFAVVPETLREALARVKVEGGAVQSVTIRRQLLLNQSGPVEWSIYVRGPRESATAYADAAGRIRRLDLSGTTRAETLDLTRGGEMLSEAIATIRDQFGTGPIFKSFGISTKSVSFKIRDQKNPTDSVGHYWDINGIHKSTDIIPAEIRRRMGEGVRDELLFSIDDVDWSRLPELRKSALEKAGVAGGNIGSIDVDRPPTEGDAKPVRWKFAVRAGLLGEGTVVEFDAKTGASTRVDLPKSRQAAVNYVEPETARRAIAAIARELSRAVGFVDITLSKERASATGPLSEKPDLIRQFFYTENDGLQPFGLPNPRNPFHQGFNKTWLFTVAELEPVLSNLGELQRKTLERLRVKDATVQRVTFFRHSEFYPQNRKVLVEIRAENPKGEDGRIVYDLNGAVVDVVGGNSEETDAADDAEAPAQLRTLGMTDATPARVKKFDSYFASFHKLVEKLGETSWYKLRHSAPDKLLTLPREKLRKFGKVQCEVLESVDGMLRVFAERTPPSDAIASSAAVPYARTREYWEEFRKYWDAACQQGRVLDKNWEDWKKIGNPPDAPNKKPWQQEMARLQGEMNAAQSRVEQFEPPSPARGEQRAELSLPSTTSAAPSVPPGTRAEDSMLIREAYEAGERHDYDQAIAKYDELIRHHPKLKEAYHNRGLAHQGKGDYTKAIADYNEAIRLDPQYAVAYHNRGNAYALQGDNRAMADYDRAIELDPTANAYGDRANAHRVKGDYVKSLADFSDSIRLDPRNAQAYFGRGFTYQATGEYDKALADYNRALELDANIAGVYLHRGYIHDRKRDYAKAIADYKEAIRLDAKIAPAYNGAAWLLATCPQTESRDGKQAVEFANKACELSEWKDPNFVDTLAAAHAEAGDFPQAIKWAQKYLESPNLSDGAVAEGKSRVALYRAGKRYHQKD